MNSGIKNILKGMGSVMDIMPFGSVDEITMSRKSDAENLQSDWIRVGQDLCTAMNQVDEEQKRKIASR